MINKLIFLFLLFSIVEASANVKERIIKNLETTNNLTFNFEQNVNGKTENGHCALSYPQKIFCKYNLSEWVRIINFYIKGLINFLYS